MQQAHFILQGKGGVGKSYAASILAQYMKVRLKDSLPVHCYDTDPVNQTFSRYAALNAKMVQILNKDDVIDSRQFDNLIEEIITEEGVAIVDNGAATFVPLLGYLKESNITEMLEDAGCQVYFHVIITGGQAMDDTILGLMTVLEKLNGKILVWGNEYFGEVSKNGNALEDFKVIEENKNRIIGIMRLNRRNADTYGKDIETMVKANLTFDEVKSSPQLTLLPRQRLMNVQRELFAALDLFALDANLKLIEAF